jgi:beta-galactosidase
VEVSNRWGWPDEYPHWNWADCENVPLQVSVYTRCDSVCLYLNGNKIEEKAVASSFPVTAVFNVPYQPGELKAVGFLNGKETAVKTLVTSGKPAKIKLTAERISVQANTNDLAYVMVEITDSEGRLVPDAAVTVHLSAAGNGQLIACGNAAPDDMKSFRNPVCTTFRGRALAILQPFNQPGNMILTAKAEGLAEEKVQISCVPAGNKQ